MSRLYAHPLILPDHTLYPGGLPDPPAQVAYVDTDALDDEYIAALAFPEGQAVFSRRAPLAGARVASCGWHGTGFDPRLGSFAIVRDDGPLVDLLGESIRVTCNRKSVLLYVCDALPALDDLSITRRAFLALTAPSKTSLTVTVQVLA